MKLLELFIQNPLATLLYLPALLQGLICNPQPKADCEQIIQIGKNMAHTEILNYGDTERMFPAVYCAGGDINNIFAVPEPNAIGTNDLDNAIKVLTFLPDDQLGQKTIKKNFLEMVSGPFDFRFLPVVNDEEVAYSQTRGFIIANIKKKAVESHTIEWKALTGSDIGNVAILDG